MNDTTEAKRIALATIPPEVLEAALQFVAMCQSYCKPTAHDCQCRQNTFFAFRAGIAAWPGMTYAKWRDYGQADRLVLPLPTENTND